MGLGVRWRSHRFGTYLSRLSFRLMAFNLLLVFLPVAGILYLGSYEETLLAAQRRTLEAEARMLAATLGDPYDVHDPAAILERLKDSAVRIRVVALNGAVLADSSPVAQIPSTRAQRNILYRMGTAVLRPLLSVFRANEPPVPTEIHERPGRLRGEEVLAALQGRGSHAERISSDRRAVIVSVAEPIRREGDVVGAVVASQSTFTILQDLYSVRLGVLRIFVVSIIVALVLSFLVSTTIVRPLRQLRMEAGSILDRSGRLRGRFKGSRKRDEIGDLSRALERLTERLDEHVRFMETFAADVSHEFKNPLASIRTATEMLAEVEEPAQRKRFLRMVEQEIARMESLLAGVREVALIDAQLSTETRRRVDLNALLGRIVEGFQLRERVSIRLDTPATACEVDASEDRLIQVFVNVLENAVSFSTVVTVRVECSGRWAVVAISDQGPGIPETNLSRVFDRFFTHRPDQTKARRTHTGLGLSIVKAIVEGYGGTITATNNPEGGARFEIRLPMA
jgi:two-component system sensor histidine kinase ChvG